MRAVIIDTGAANIASVANALERGGYGYEVSGDEATISSADRVILPGVGNAQAAMRGLGELGLSEAIKSLQAPTLGICLGMQLLGSFSSEQDTELLGIVDDRFVQFNEAAPRSVHIGWNQIKSKDDCLFSGIDDGSYVYFAHSYATSSQANEIASTSFGSEFSSAIRSNNFRGVQFHPEKSGDVGAKILSNFMELSQ